MRRFYDCVLRTRFLWIALALLFSAGFYVLFLIFGEGENRFLFIWLTPPLTAASVWIGRLILVSQRYGNRFRGEGSFYSGATVFFCIAVLSTVAGALHFFAEPAFFFSPIHSVGSIQFFSVILALREWDDFRKTPTGKGPPAGSSR